MGWYIALYVGMLMVPIVDEDVSAWHAEVEALTREGERVRTSARAALRELESLNADIGPYARLLVAIKKLRAATSAAPDETQRQSQDKPTMHTPKHTPRCARDSDWCDGVICRERGIDCPYSDAPREERH